MTEFARSADGTAIAYDRHGDGPAVICLGGATQFRAFDPTTTELCRELAARGHAGVWYDRRGRGESGDTPPFAVDREVEDLAALIAAVGGRATLFGNSSGGVLALHAAAALDEVDAVVGFELPLSLEGEGDGGAYLRGLQERNAAGDRAGAIELYMDGMPPEWLEGVRNSPAWPAMLSVAPTLAYDAATLHRADSRPWAEQWASVVVPVLVLVGQESLPIFPPAAEALVTALPQATYERFPSSDHRWAPAAMADRIAAFLRR